MSSLRITYKSFDQLTPAELYSILQLRSEVFVVEQNCVFQDMDGRDPQCFHVMINQPELIAYARLVPAGVYYKEMSVGRVITKASVRGTGIGKILMERCVQLCYEIWGAANIRIGAQCYAEKFYGSLGFSKAGDIYEEDGIPHVEMVKEYTFPGHS
jgi:ElaA protein